MRRRITGTTLFTAAALVAGGLLPLAQLAAAPAAHASTVLSKDVTANLFEWNWSSVATECTQVLGPDGYAAVQVAPPEDSLDSAAHSWWDVYQPVDYGLTSRLGSAAQFQAMVTACHAAGVKVYADAVLNQMAAQPSSGSQVSYGGQSYTAGTLAYPGYSAADFHSYPADCPEPGGSIVDWDSYTEVTQCRLDGMPDLATESAHVRSTEAGYLNALIADGVDGFRIDSAKDIGETDIAAIEALLNKDTSTGQPVAVSQEVAAGDSTQDVRLDPASFVPEGSVIGFDFAYALDAGFTGDIADLDTFTPSVPSADETSLVTNQDTERAGSTLSYKSGAAYTLANEFLLAYGYGSPQIYSSFDWSSYNQSPPSDSNGFVTATTCGSGWECTDRTPAVAALVPWHNLALTNGDAVAHWYSDGSNLIAFSRGSDAWIALNNESAAKTETFTTGLPDGVYCDIVNDTYAAATGSCSGPGITVSGGQATVTVPADGSVAFDVDTAVTATPTPAHTETVDVTVPVNTAATGDGVYLDGNFSVLGNGGADWAASGVAMTKVDDTHYTATISATSAAALSYKYVLGANWSYVEKSASCADISNRALTVNGGTVNDTVLNWGGPSTCGNAEAVIDLTVPSSTPGTDTVYLAGAFSALGTGMGSANDWAPGLYPMTRTGTDTWQAIVPAVPGSTLSYKFDLNGTWTNVEEGGSCAAAGNRSFTFNGADSSYTAADTVSAWAGLNGC